MLKESLLRFYGATSKLAFPGSLLAIDITPPHNLYQRQPMPMWNSGPASNNSSSSMKQLYMNYELLSCPPMALPYCMGRPCYICHGPLPYLMGRRIH
ncbi:hypothetical protein G2W53_017666 [Senna tora]|uniref:Uncharacterized protein n=1 Tax=Senna tora TaxID=362788 RepID=A0A834TRB3_9FABA|nr:hypothetical protein G2W53_017666 [Senna tora]